MTLQEHIDQVTENVKAKITEMGLDKASHLLGITKSYACRIANGAYKLSAEKLIDYAKRLGVS